MEHANHKHMAGAMAHTDHKSMPAGAMDPTKQYQKLLLMVVLSFISMYVLMYRMFQPQNPWIWGK